MGKPKVRGSASEGVAPRTRSVLLVSDDLGRTDSMTLASQLGVDPTKAPTRVPPDIEEVLTRCSGNRAATARILRIPRRTLLRKLDKNPPRE